MPKKKEEPEKVEKVGGVAFLSSVPVVLGLFLFNCIVLPVLIIDPDDPYHIFIFLVTFAVGIFGGLFFIRNRFSVFLHELKHLILANLAGNRTKGMKVDRESGHFEYSYTKATAKYNALIALAPYFLPILSIGLLVFTVPFVYASKPALLVVLGLGYGADLAISLRDLSPHQSDLTSLRGGYPCGALFLLGIHGTIATFLIAYICGGSDGMLFMVLSLFEALRSLVGR